MLCVVICAYCLELCVSYVGVYIARSALRCVRRGVCLVCGVFLRVVLSCVCFVILGLRS